jgi:hypothetical protein
MVADSPIEQANTFCQNLAARPFYSKDDGDATLVDRRNCSKFSRM